MQDTAHRCMRSVAPAECIPGGSLSASSYISNLHLSATPGAAPAVAPALQTSRFVGGSIVPLADDGNLPEPLFDTARGLCANVPQRIAYSVLTLDGGAIAEVRVDVTVANVSVATSGSLVVQQAFSVTFQTISSSVCISFHSTPLMGFERALFWLGLPACTLHSPDRLLVQSRGCVLEPPLDISNHREA